MSLTAGARARAPLDTEPGPRPQMDTAAPSLASWSQGSVQNHLLSQAALTILDASFPFEAVMLWPVDNLIMRAQVGGRKSTSDNARRVSGTRQIA